MAGSRARPRRTVNLRPIGDQIHMTRLTLPFAFARGTFGSVLLCLPLCGAWMWTSPAPVVAAEQAIPVAAVPDSLTNAGEFAENIYDHARDGDWSGAAKKITALRAALVQLKIGLAKTSP